MMPVVFRTQIRIDAKLSLDGICSDQGEIIDISKSGLRVQGFSEVTVGSEVMICEQPFRLIWADNGICGLQVVEPSVDNFALLKDKLPPLAMDTSLPPAVDFRKIISNVPLSSETACPYVRLSKLAGIKFYNIEIDGRELIVAISEDIPAEVDWYSGRGYIAILASAKDGEWYKRWPLSVGEDLRSGLDKKAKRVLKEMMGHIEGVMKSLELVTKDRNAIESWLEIGQRFNGIYGTAWNFASGRPGYDLVAYLSEVIDTVVRTYQIDTSLVKVDEEHFAVVSKSILLADAILIELRNGNSEFSALHTDFRKVRKAYRKLDCIQRRNSLSQDQVDMLMGGPGQ